MVATWDMNESRVPGFRLGGTSKRDQRLKKRECGQDWGGFSTSKGESPSGTGPPWGQVILGKDKELRRKGGREKG